MSKRTREQSYAGAGAGAGSTFNDHDSDGSEKTYTSDDSDSDYSDETYTSNDSRDLVETIKYKINLKEEELKTKRSILAHTLLKLSHTNKVKNPEKHNKIKNVVTNQLFLLHTLEEELHELREKLENIQSESSRNIPTNAKRRKTKDGNKGWKPKIRSKRKHNLRSKSRNNVRKTKNQSWKHNLRSKSRNNVRKTKNQRWKHNLRSKPRKNSKKH